MPATAKVSRVALVVAMQEEAKPLVERLGLTKRADALDGAPAIVYDGEHGGGYVAVVTPGLDAASGLNLIGTDAAALTTFLAVRALAPDLLITAGTCGGFKRQGGRVGDAYCVTSFQHHDRRIAIPGYDALGVAKRDAHKTPAMVAALGFKTGACSTGNSLDMSPEDDDRLKDAVAKDMEAAAVAWAADLAGGVPLVGIKVVTDIVDGDKPTQEEFLENLHTAAESLQATIPKVLDFVLHRDLTDL